MNKYYPISISEFKELLNDAIVAHKDSNDPIPELFKDSLGKVDNCLKTPFQNVFHTELYPTIYDKAAILMYLFIKNHPLANGNKRMAFITTFAFLYKNGIELNLTNEQVYDLTKYVASSKSTNKDEVLQYIKNTIMQQTNNGKKGGLLQGETHENGGIKAIVTDSKAPVELENNEVIITAPAVEDPKEHTYTGTNKEVLSEINENAGGVSIMKKGGLIGKKVHPKNVPESIGEAKFHDENGYFVVFSDGSDGYFEEDQLTIHNMNPIHTGITIKNKLASQDEAEWQITNISNDSVVLKHNTHFVSPKPNETFTFDKLRQLFRDNKIEISSIKEGDNEKLEMALSLLEKDNEIKKFKDGGSIKKIEDLAEILGSESDKKIEERDKWIEYVSASFKEKFNTDYRPEYESFYSSDRKSFLAEKRKDFENKMEDGGFIRALIPYTSTTEDLSYNNFNIPIYQKPNSDEIYIFKDDVEPIWIEQNKKRHKWNLDVESKKNEIKKIEKKPYTKNTKLKIERMNSIDKLKRELELLEKDQPATTVSQIAPKAMSLIYDEKGKSQTLGDYQQELMSKFYKEIYETNKNQRGGNIIGTTQSGKTIYDNFSNKKHSDFTIIDHEDATKQHMEELSNRKSKHSDTYHDEEAASHNRKADIMKGDVYRDPTKKYKKGGSIPEVKITKNEFTTKEDQPERVYHWYEGTYGDYNFTADTDNSHKSGYRSDGINKGSIYRLNIWKPQPTGPIAIFSKKWDYRTKDKKDGIARNTIIKYIDSISDKKDGTPKYKKMQRGGPVGPFYEVELYWKGLQPSERKIGKYVVTESGLHKLEDEWGYNLNIDVIDESKETPITFTNLSKMIMVSAKEKGVYKKGGLVNPKGTNKIRKVLEEFKQRKLKTPQNKTVTNKKQAVAIALSEQRAYDTDKLISEQKERKARKMSQGGKLSKTQFTNTVDGRNTPYEINHKVGSDNTERKKIAETILAENGETISIELLGNKFKSNSFYKSLSGKSWAYKIPIDEHTYKHFAGNYGVKKDVTEFILEIDSNGLGYLRTGKSMFNFDLSNIKIL